MPTSALSLVGILILVEDKLSSDIVMSTAQALNRWGYYPLILIGSFTFGTINRIYGFIEPHQPLFWLYCLDIGTASLMVILLAPCISCNTRTIFMMEVKLHKMTRSLLTHR